MLWREWAMANLKMSTSNYWHNGSWWILCALNGKNLMGMYSLQLFAERDNLYTTVDSDHSSHTNKKRQRNKENRSRCRCFWYYFPIAGTPSKAAWDSSSVKWRACIRFTLDVGAIKPLESSRCHKSATARYSHPSGQIFGINCAF